MKLSSKWLAVAAAAAFASAPVWGVPQAPAPGSSSATASSKSAASASTKKTASKKKRRSKREPTQMTPTPERISEIQSALSRSGYYTGNPNGKWDSSSVAAMQKFQSANGLDASGKVDALSLQKLGLGSSVAGVSAPKPATPHAPPASSAPPHTVPSQASPSSGAPASSAKTADANSPAAATSNGTSPPASAPPKR